MPDDDIYDDAPVEIPEDDGAPDIGLRDVPDAGDGDPDQVVLVAGDDNALAHDDADADA